MEDITEHDSELEGEGYDIEQSRIDFFVSGGALGVRDHLHRFRHCILSELCRGVQLNLLLVLDVLSEDFHLALHHFVHQLHITLILEFNDGVEVLDVNKWDPTLSY